MKFKVNRTAVMNLCVVLSIGTGLYACSKGDNGTPAPGAAPAKTEAPVKAEKAPPPGYMLSPEMFDMEPTMPDFGEHSFAMDDNEIELILLPESFKIAAQGSDKYTFSLGYMFQFRDYEAKSIQRDSQPSIVSGIITKTYNELGDEVFESGELKLKGERFIRVRLVADQGDLSKAKIVVQAKENKNAEYFAKGVEFAIGLNQVHGRGALSFVLDESKALTFNVNAIELKHDKLGHVQMAIPLHVYDTAQEKIILSSTLRTELQKAKNSKTAFLSDLVKLGKVLAESGVVRSERELDFGTIQIALDLDYSKDIFENRMSVRIMRKSNERGAVSENVQLSLNTPNFHKDTEIGIGSLILTNSTAATLFGNKLILRAEGEQAGAVIKAILPYQVLDLRTNTVIPSYADKQAAEKEKDLREGLADLESPQDKKNAMVVADMYNLRPLREAEAKLASAKANLRRQQERYKKERTSDKAMIAINRARGELRAAEKNLADAKKKYASATEKTAQRFDERRAKEIAVARKALDELLHFGEKGRKLEALLTATSDERVYESAPVQIERTRWLKLRVTLPERKENGTVKLEVTSLDRTQRNGERAALGSETFYVLYSKVFENNCNAPPASGNDALMKSSADLEKSIDWTHPETGIYWNPDGKHFSVKIMRKLPENFKAPESSNMAERVGEFFGNRFMRHIVNGCNKDIEERGVFQTIEGKLHQVGQGDAFTYGTCDGRLSVAAHPRGENTTLSQRALVVIRARLNNCKTFEVVREIGGFAKPLPVPQEEKPVDNVLDLSDDTNMDTDLHQNP